MNDNSEKGYITRQLMTYGAIIGILTTAYSLILFATGTNEFIPKQNESLLGNLRQFIIILGLIYSLKHLSDKVIKAKLTFSKYLLYGTGIGFFYSIIDSAYFVIFLNFLAPETLNFYIDSVNEIFKNSVLTADEISLIIQKLQKPFTLFISYLFSNTILIAVFSVFIAFINSLTSAILPKK